MPSRERQLKLAGYSLRELDLDHIVSNHKWPAKHTDTFTHVTTVGKTDYEKYFENLTIETQNRPWRAQTKRRAQLIAALAW
jgi:hypothetical protein